MEGSASLRMARRFGANSPARSEIPVMFPPGRRKLATSPSDTKSPAPDAMAGTDAPLQAAMAGKPEVRIASSLLRVIPVCSDRRAGHFRSAPDERTFSECLGMSQRANRGHFNRGARQVLRL